MKVTHVTSTNASAGNCGIVAYFKTGQNQSKSPWEQRKWGEVSEVQKRKLTVKSPRTT